MGMKLLTEIFLSVKEKRRTRGHGVTLAKMQCRIDIRQFSFSQRTNKNRTDYQPTVKVLVVLIYLKTKSTHT